VAAKGNFMPTLKPSESKRLTLKKRDVLKMLMTMDRYQVDSVVIRQEDDYFNWELPMTKSFKLKSAETAKSS